MELTTIKRYTRRPHFADFSGIDRTAYYVAIGQHRDSDVLTQSNFRSLLRAIGGETETVVILRDSHFLVGWVEAIYIHESDTAALQTADRILARLNDYPVVDEEDWSALEWETASAYWARASVRERLDWCRRYRVSIFAARRAEIPEDPSGELVSYLAE